MVSQGIQPEQLLFTTVLAAQLANVWSNQGSEHKRALTDHLHVDFADSFSEIGGDHVYPVLRKKENASWAEIWRG